MKISHGGRRSKVDVARRSLSFFAYKVWMRALQLCQDRGDLARVEFLGGKRRDHGVGFFGKFY